MNILRRLPDPLSFALGALLTVIGLFAIYDAGYARSIQLGAGAIPREFKMQVMFAVVGIAIGFMVSRIRRETVSAIAWPFFLIVIAMLIAVEIPGIGVTMNGGRRWIDLGPFTVQPAEFAKVAVIVWLAAVLAARTPWKEPTASKKSTVAGWLDYVLLPKLMRSWPALVSLGVIYLIEQEPDLGTAAIVLFSMFMMLYMGGVTRRSMLWLTATLALGATLLTLKEPYRLERIVNHSKRWESTVMDDVGYQTTQSETAMASGHIVGVGPGSGRAKHMLPAATTDFIMATVAEEFGLFGSLIVIGLIAALVFRLMALAGSSRDTFARCILGGTACWIGVQSCVNIMMANGTLPPIGIPLPFVSSGGSSLLALWIGLGVCQSLAAPVKASEGAVEAGRDRWRNRRTRLSRA